MVGFWGRLVRNVGLYFACVPVFALGAWLLVALPAFLITGDSDGAGVLGIDVLFAGLFYGLAAAVIFLPIACLPFLLLVELAGRWVDTPTLRWLVVASGAVAGLVVFGASPNDPILLALVPVGMVLGLLLKLPVDSRHASQTLRSLE